MIISAKKLQKWLRSVFGQRRRPDKKFARLGFELLETRETPSTLMVISAADPVALTAGTLRYAVNQANTDAGNGQADTIVFNTTLMQTNTISLLQGPISLSGAGAIITINGAARSRSVPASWARTFRSLSERKLS